MAFALDCDPRLALKARRLAVCFKVCKIHMVLISYASHFRATYL
jgi:hypothetical protein